MLCLASQYILGQERHHDFHTGVHIKLITIKTKVRKKKGKVERKKGGKGEKNEEGPRLVPSTQALNPQGTLVSKKLIQEFNVFPNLACLPL